MVDKCVENVDKRNRHFAQNIPIYDEWFGQNDEFAKILEFHIATVLNYEYTINKKIL